MAQQTINVGSAPNDGTGDPVRDAFNKCNNNFTELYAGGVGGGGGGFTASSTAPISPTVGDLWYDLSTGVLSIYVNDGTSSQWVMVAPSGGGGGASAPTPPQGRLTLQTGTPVMTTTQAAKTTLFYSPYIGNSLPIYGGSSFTMTTFAELSVATTDTTKNPSAIGANKVNDWFVWNDAGTLRLSHGPDWTTDILRAPAGNTPIMINGVWLNNAAITNGPASQRGTYVGTTRSNASSQLDWIFGSIAANGGMASHYIWNMYNRVDVASCVRDSSDSWSWSTTNTWRAANASNTNRVNYVVGLDEDTVRVMYAAIANGASGSGWAGIGFDLTTAFIGTSAYIGVGGYSAAPALYKGNPGLGAHFFSAIEATLATTSYLGDNAIPLFTQSGLYFELRM